MDSKKDIRKNVLNKRNQLTKTEWEDKSRIIYDKVIAHSFFLSSDTILCYVDYRNEVGTRDIIQTAWDMQKTVAVPKVEGDELSFYVIHTFDDLQEGFKGILEPKSTELFNNDNMLVIMPGAAFDSKKNRIGYGKGFYDKFLMKCPEAKTIGLGFECQIVEEVPAEEHDLRPSVLITEEHIYV